MCGPYPLLVFEHARTQPRPHAKHAERDMKRLPIGAALLLLACQPALAGWTQLGETGAAVYYIDQATMDKEGVRRRAWTLQDLKQLHRSGALSRRIQFEYDCRRVERRILEWTSYSSPMADGDIVNAKKGDLKKWEAIPPGTPAALAFETVCETSLPRRTPT